MLNAPVPPNETERLAALRSLDILDTPAEERFDRIARMAQHIFHVPFVTLSLVDGSRVWFKSRVGIEASEGPRAVSFCGHAMVHDGLLIVPDTREDPRFADNPMVAGQPYIRFCAGYPLSNAAGFRIGAFCIKDTRPRELTEEEKKMLVSRAAWAEL
ncbi:MAG: GAF domain-containing protein [Candidatus Omnitrophica bacterium]|nr:GAF domain-containing protein [Candidatus Omnitrophota bacterium]